MDERNEVGFEVFGDQICIVFGKRILLVRCERRPSATLMMAYLLFLAM
jgi:hypothetical protein